METKYKEEFSHGAIFEGEIDKYVLSNYLSCGGYSKVFTAAALANNQNVVLKLMHRKMDSMLEASMLMHLNGLALRNSEHICKILDVINVEEYSSFGMVLEKGACSLLDFMTANNMEPVDPRYIQPIIYQLLSAIDSLNEFQIVHVDVKPENIIFKSTTKFYSYNESGKRLIELGDLQIMLCDFNCSMHFNSFCVTGGVCQTFHYRSPEVILGIKDIRYIDVFSTGAIMAELATGHLLFDMDGKNDATPTLEQRAQHLRLLEIEMGECPESVLQESAFEFFAIGEWRECLPPPTVCNNTQFQLWRTIALQSKRQRVILEAIDGMLAWPTIRHTAETAMQLPFFTARKNVHLKLHEGMVQVTPRDFVRMKIQQDDDMMDVEEYAMNNNY